MVLKKRCCLKHINLLRCTYTRQFSDDRLGGAGKTYHLLGGQLDPEHRARVAFLKERVCVWPVPKKSKPADSDKEKIRRDALKVCKIGGNRAVLNGWMRGDESDLVDEDHGLLDSHFSIHFLICRNLMHLNWSSVSRTGQGLISLPKSPPYRMGGLSKQP